MRGAPCSVVAGSAISMAASGSSLEGGVGLLQLVERAPGEPGPGLRRVVEPDDIDRLPAHDQPSRDPNRSGTRRVPAAQPASARQERAPEVGEGAEQHPEPHEPPEAKRVAGGRVAVLFWCGIARMAHGGGNCPQPGVAFWAGNQALADDRAEADAVAIDLAPAALGVGRMLAPDDRVGLVEDRVARSKEPDEQIDVLAAASCRRRTQREVEAAELAADVREHDDARARSEAGRRVSEEGMTVTGVGTMVGPSRRTVTGQLRSGSHRVVELRGRASTRHAYHVGFAEKGVHTVTHPLCIDDDVVVDEGDDHCLSPSQPGVPRHRRRGPRLLQVAQSQFSRELHDQHPGGVRRRRPVIDDDHLEVVVVGVQNRAQAALQRRRVTARRDDDAHRAWRVSALHGSRPRPCSAANLGRQLGCPRGLAPSALPARSMLCPTASRPPRCRAGCTLRMSERGRDGQGSGIELRGDANQLSRPNLPLRRVWRVEHRFIEIPGGIDRGIPGLPRKSPGPGWG